MRRTGVWQVTDKGPTELPSTTVELEKELESWIERDPGLLRRGLTIVGRQMGTEAGPLDLLAIDPEGRWVVIEIKKGSIDRLTIAQAVDYASCIAAMSAEVLERKVNAYLKAHGDGDQTLRDILPGAADGEDADRDVMMIVVGTGAVPGLERMAGFLSDRCGVPIDIVTFDVFTTASGDRILVRELTEGPGPTTGTGSRRPVASLDQLFADAEEQGVGEPFRAIYAAATEIGLYARRYRWSIMYTPPSNGSRCLFTTTTQCREPGKLRTWIEASAFSEFFDVTEQTLADHLGGIGAFEFSPADTETFIDGLRRLFTLIEERNQGTEMNDANTQP